MKIKQLHYMECARVYTPYEVTIQWCDSAEDSAANTLNREMIVPKPTSNYRLYAYLHECGHLALNHYSHDSDLAFYEYQAVRYAFGAMEKSNIRILPKTMYIAKYNLAEYVSYDVKRGFRIYNEILNFIDGIELDAYSELSINEKVILYNAFASNA